ncbi:hypothetical protein AQJ84_18770 [Streptomyces resistomycificus]|uniref:Uncharacterized protein n=1 Tax=Streptomyces resistomycificus TaxID=67356 RepID=A0A0L8KP88_9ACTN|nr:hypothetical protein ADK37_40495 [Streptomyces resistomycificus]KUN96432.1 hypothetical protein AQJ84_18770 [Streptomyces resistomycificus]
MLVGVCLRPDTVDPGVVVGRELDMYGPFGGSPGEYRQTFMVGPVVAPPRQSGPAVCRPLAMSLLQLEGRVGDRLL